jgi:hypothetical protein
VEVSVLAGAFFGVGEGVGCCAIAVLVNSITARANPDKISRDFLVVRIADD